MAPGNTSACRMPGAWVDSSLVRRNSKPVARTIVFANCLTFEGIVRKPVQFNDRIGHL